MSAGKILIDVSDCNSFKALRWSLDRLSLWGLEFWSLMLTLARIVSASSFSRSFTVTSTVAMISSLGSVLEVIKKSRPFARRSVSIWVNCLDEILLTYFFLSAILLSLCVTLFLQINSLNFGICPFFGSSQDFLYKFSWIFSTRWNSSGLIDSKILPFNCSMLFLSLSRLTWLICIRSCSNSLPVHCKILTSFSVDCAF